MPRAEDRFERFLGWTRDLRLSEVRVLAAVISKANRRSRWVAYTLSDLCAWTGLRESTVMRAVHALTQQGILVRRHDTAEGYAQGRAANEYKVVWEPEDIAVDQC